MHARTEFEESRPAGSKRKLRWIAGLFVAFLAAFTLYSNTLFSLTLPKATTTVPQSGSLEHSFQGSAIAEPAATVDLTNPAGWKVAKVNVKTGDKVHKGQILVEYDGSEAEQQVKDEEAALQKLNLALPQLQAAYIEAAHGDDSAALQDARTALESAKIDIQTQKEHLQALQKQLSANGEIAAPFDGTVLEVHAVEDLAVAAGGGPDIRLAGAQQGFRIALTVPEDVASLLNVGDPVDAVVSGKQPRTIQGTVAAIEDDAPAEGGPSAGDDSGAGGSTAAANRVTVTLQDPKLKGGERIQLQWSLSSGQDAMLLPNEAVHRDDAGAYVWTVQTRSGPLGNAFYAARTSVTVVDSNEYQTEIGDGLFEQDEVVSWSSEPLLDGSRIRL
ncbi:efflux RND transporter periplasmic adaptor subunit [Cohnella zeiphila]|uniref:Efflux RND transporter periplasmic adaptor subunit n=1 Tax=Cohnella zeiphila TaxID=2761120 RepID=A0A7X0SQI0_9BACL|nr:efflux RND transporter periplasmic adaptor subunit [Cohnella zeiphila]MBB6734278.1 efflux RND transporter periplasmic adaptor subunit [Cohnella zeiphila]